MSFSQDMDGRIFKTLLQEGFWIQTVKETFTHFQQMEEIIRNGELKALETKPLDWQTLLLEEFWIQMELAMLILFTKMEETIKNLGSLNPDLFATFISTILTLLSTE